MKILTLSLFLVFIAAACSNVERDSEASTSESASIGVDSFTTRILQEGVKHTVYLPVYSNVAVSGGDVKVPMTVTLSVRNTDLAGSFVVSKVEYFTSEGIRAREYIENPMRVDKLETIEFIIPQKDLVGGSGANFIIEWTSNEEINAPIFQGVHVNSNSGISFITHGREL